MAKVNTKDYGTRSEKLTQDDLEADVVVLTLEAVEQIDVPDADAPTGSRKAMKLMFVETPKVLWPGKSQIDSLVARLGDDDDDWAGERVVIEKHSGTFRGKPYANVRVCGADEWDDYLKSSKPKKSRR